MLNLMSYYYPKGNFNSFFEKHEKDIQKIFAEIYEFLGDKEFKTHEDFKNTYKSLLSHEEDKFKELPSGLILKIGDNFSKLELTDKNSNFTISIDFIKKIPIFDKISNKTRKRFLISETYLIQYYKFLKHKEIKFKFKNISEEISLLSGDFKINVIYNNDFEYISIDTAFNEIYDEIFKILEKEKTLKIITTADLFNDFRILNFPEIKKEYIDKIELKDIEHNDFCSEYKYLCYNKKIGLTLSTQKLLILEFQSDKKFFYLNIDFLCNETNKEKIRKYLFFYISFLFSINEKNNFKNFIENNIISLIHLYNGKELIIKLFELLCKKFEFFKLYIDNVKTKVQFDIVQKILGLHYFDDFFVLVQVNALTLSSLFTVNFRLFDYMERQYSIKEDLEYYINISLNNLDDKTIKKNYSKKLQPFFNNFNYDSYLFLLRLKYLLKKKEFDLVKLYSISEFIEFLVVNMNIEKVYEIRFRNEFIEEMFNDYYLSYTTKFKNLNTNIIFDISKSEEGILFERQIIYDLILNDLNINKIKVDEIYSINTFSNLELNNKEEFLFIQTKPNAAYYDIAFIYSFNGLIILKVCQIGINKSIDDLKKLNKNFLLFDLYYFCQKLKYEKNINVDKIEICLITTFNAYEENEKFLNNQISSKDLKYGGFIKMKEFCKENDFIFLIFDIKSSEFYCYDNGNKLKKTDLKNNDFQFDVKKIFTKTKVISKTKKLKFNFDPENPMIIAEIKLLSDFNIEKLNNEFVFQIKKGKAIFKQNIILEPNDNIKENKIETDKDIKSKALKKKIKSNNKNKNDESNNEEEEEIEENNINVKKKNKPLFNNEDSEKKKNLLLKKGIERRIELKKMVEIKINKFIVFNSLIFILNFINY